MQYNTLRTTARKIILGLGAGALIAIPSFAAAATDAQRAAFLGHMETNVATVSGLKDGALKTAVLAHAAAAQAYYSKLPQHGGGYLVPGAPGTGPAAGPGDEKRTAPAGGAPPLKHVKEDARLKALGSKLSAAEAEELARELEELAKSPSSKVKQNGFVGGRLNFPLSEHVGRLDDVIHGMKNFGNDLCYELYTALVNTLKRAETDAYNKYIESGDSDDSEESQALGLIAGAIPDFSKGNACDESLVSRALAIAVAKAKDAGGESDAMGDADSSLNNQLNMIKALAAQIAPIAKAGDVLAQDIRNALKNIVSSPDKDGSDRKRKDALIEKLVDIGKQYDALKDYEDVLRRLMQQPGSTARGFGSVEDEKILIRIIRGGS